MSVLFIDLSSVDPLFSPLHKVRVNLLYIFIRHGLDPGITVFISAEREKRFEGHIVLPVSSPGGLGYREVLTSLFTRSISPCRSFVLASATFTAISDVSVALRHYSVTMQTHPS